MPLLRVAKEGGEKRRKSLPAPPFSDSILILKPLNEKAHQSKSTYCRYPSYSRVNTPCTLPTPASKTLSPDPSPPWHFQHRLSRAKNQRRVSLPLPRNTNTTLSSSPSPNPYQSSILNPQSPTKAPPRETSSARRSGNRDTLDVAAFAKPYSIRISTSVIYQHQQQQERSKAP